MDLIYQESFHFSGSELRHTVYILLGEIIWPLADVLLHDLFSIAAFQCHPDGCPAMLYAPQHQTLITSGKKGEICIFDIRQRQLRQTFQAHDSAIKTMALDPTEEYFITGAVDGDIKVIRFGYWYSRCLAWTVMVINAGWGGGRNSELRYLNSTLFWSYEIIWY